MLVFRREQESNPETRWHRGRYITVLDNDIVMDGFFVAHIQEVAMKTLSLEEIKAYAGEYKVVPLGRSMYADVRTPVEVLRIVKNVSSHCYILESMEDAKR